MLLLGVQHASILLFLTKDKFFFAEELYKRVEAAVEENYVEVNQVRVMNVYASVGTSWLDLIDLSILALCITY
jgi:hypothetical protein